MQNNYDRQILALTDDELEKFTRDWVDAKKAAYFSVTRFSGSGDMGRDVVGFLSKELHEGDWHNYQCKQYASKLGVASALNELGKVFYYASQGNFTTPKKYYFVTPRGVNRTLEALIFKPTEFKKKLISEWDEHCSKKISKGAVISLTDKIIDVINSFDFSSIERIKIDDILLDASSKPILFKWFGADPGPAPNGITPTEIQNLEILYISKLVKAYSIRDGLNYSGHDEVKDHAIYGRHLSRQRERFYDADAFKLYYRDNTDTSTLVNFESDVLHGVIDVCESKHTDPLSRVEAVMSQAANVQVSGPLSKYARVQVKQGICHHFANEDKLKWEE